MAEGLGASLTALITAYPIVLLLAVVAVMMAAGIGVALGAWAMRGHAAAELGDTQSVARDGARR